MRRRPSPPRLGARLLAGRELARALGGLARTTVLFRLGGAGAVARVANDAMWVPELRSAREPTREELSRSLRAVRRAKAIWPAPVLCLQSSLVLCSLYVRRGYPARLCLGVRVEGTELVSHAWVDVEGIAVDDARGSEAGWSLIGTPSEPAS